MRSERAQSRYNRNCRETVDKGDKPRQEDPRLRSGRIQETENSRAAYHSLVNLNDQLKSRDVPNNMKY